MEDQLVAASGLLSDVETVYFTTPTCYPEREVDGEDRHSHDAEVLTLFIQLFDRIADLQPEIAEAHAVSWPETDKFFFRKLKLYALYV